MSAIDPMQTLPGFILEPPVVVPTPATIVAGHRTTDTSAVQLETSTPLDDGNALFPAGAPATSQCRGPETHPSVYSPNPVERLVGTTVGKFRIEAIIASGGMGTVYKAQQLNPVRRPVALKMIKAGLADQQTLARFLAERQVLALMDHPDIARVYEADATEDGTPYLAMEFCDGEPLDQYCQRNQLGIRQRIELVIRIARAVSRAHSHGVVHRDLKPGNILIANCGDRPQLKVIDFGIAKWIDATHEVEAHETQVGEMVGTPAYMSPEQAAGDIDARTDVFAIGAILFKLLTGTTPLAPPPDSKPNLSQVIQHVQSFQGLTPSQRFRELSADAKQQLLQELGMHKTAQWPAIVKGDLDWITLRAIESDRTQRYATASDLADDLDRYLRNEPVVAAAPSRLYRWKKFYQRRKPLVWSLCVVATSLVIAASFSGLTWWHSHQQLWLETQRVSTEAGLLIEEAKELRAEAANSPLVDPARHVAARTATAKAESLLMNRLDLMSLAQSLSTVQTQLNRDQQGYELATALDEARQQATEVGRLEAGDNFGRLEGLRKLHSAFETYGIIPVQTPPCVAAEQIVRLPRSVQLPIGEALDFLLYEDPFGAGLYLHQQGGRITVAEVVHGGGAERAAQFRVGDRILEIDGVSLVESFANDEIRSHAYRLLSGKPGQRIAVTYVRGLSEPKQGEIVCGGQIAHWAQQLLTILDSDPWRTKLRLAVLQSDLKQLRQLSGTVDLSSQRPFNLIQLAGTLFLLERTNEALRFLELAQQHHPQNFWANHYLGTALAVAHDPPQPEIGIRYLTAAVSLRPNSAGARMNLAEVLLQLGHEREAIAHFEAAKKLSPSHVPLERRLKSLLERTQSSDNLIGNSRSDANGSLTDESTSDKLHARPDRSGGPECFANLDWLEQKARNMASSGQRREALQLVREAEEYHVAKQNNPVPDDGYNLDCNPAGVLRRIKGVVLLELQDFVAARVVLADAARLNPGDAATRFYYGVALEYSGDSQAAVLEYEAALRIRPDYEAVREFLRNLKGLK